MNNRYLPEGELIREYENREYTSSLHGLEKAYERRRILESFALLSDGELNLHFDLGGIRGIMPREEVVRTPAGEAVKDIAIITRVGRPVCFVITDLFFDSGGRLAAKLSRARAQKIAFERRVSRLVPGDIINARITHLESFGAFADVGCGLVALMTVDAMSV